MFGDNHVHYNHPHYEQPHFQPQLPPLSTADLRLKASGGFKALLRQPGPPIWSIHPEAIGHTKPYLETFRESILPIFPITSPETVARIEKLIDEERYLDLAAGTTFIYQAAAFGALHRALLQPDPCPQHLSKVAQFRLWASQSEGLENQRQYDYTGTGLRDIDHVLLMGYWDVLVGSPDERNSRRNVLEQVIMNLQDSNKEHVIPIILCGELIKALGSKNMRQHGKRICNITIPQEDYDLYRTRPDIAASLVNRLSILSFEGNLSEMTEKAQDYDFLTICHLQEALPQMRMPYHCNPESLFVVERKYATLSRFIAALGDVSTSFFTSQGTEVSAEARDALCTALQTSFYEAIAKSLTVTFGFKLYPTELEYEVLCMLAESCQVGNGFYRLSSINAEIYAVARLQDLYRRDPVRVKYDNMSRLQNRFYDFLEKITPKNPSRVPKVRFQDPPQYISDSDSEDEQRRAKRRKITAGKQRARI